MDKKRKRREGNRDRKEGRPDPSIEHILQFMEEEDRPLLLREILRRMGLQKEQRQKVKALFKDLTEEGKVIRIRGNRYGLPSKMDLVIGRVKCHPDGYGFVIPEKEGEEDIFIRPRNLKEAMHGDRVAARVESIQKKGKEGSVIRILERGRKKIVGKFMKGKN